MFLVVAATGDAVVNRAVADAARERSLLVNVVDDADLSSFHVPARVERGPLQVAISSGGGAPMLARRLREQLERQLDESLGRSEEHTSELQSLMRISYAVFCLKKKNKIRNVKKP